MELEELLHIYFNVTFSKENKSANFQMQFR